MNKLKKNCEVIRAIIDSYHTGIPKLTINNYAETFNLALDEVDLVINKILMPLREIEHLEKMDNDSRKYIPVPTRAIKFESFYLLLSSKPTQLLAKEFKLKPNMGYGRITNNINEDTLVQTYDSWLKIPPNQAIWYENKLETFKEMKITDTDDVGDFEYYCPWKNKNKKKNYFNFSDLDSGEKKMVHIVKSKKEEIHSRSWLKFSNRPGEAHTLAFDDNKLKENGNEVRLFLRHQAFLEKNQKTISSIKRNDNGNFYIENLFLPDEEKAALLAFSEVEMNKDETEIERYTFSNDYLPVINKILDGLTT